jgi:hypothetical protein
MKDIRLLSDEALVSETKSLVREERRVSIAVLQHLREMDRRRLFARFGFSSLYEYVTQELGYSEAAAQRRIQSARLLSECPELAPRIESGDLSLTVLSQAQTFFRKEEVKDVEEKREILKSLEGESARGAERKLLALSTEPALHVPERMRPISANYSEIRFAADSELIAQIEELKGLLAEESLREVLAFAVRVALLKKRPKAPASAAASAHPSPAPTPMANSEIDSPPAPEVKVRQPTAETKRIVWARDGGRCAYCDPESGRRCESRFGLEYDHLLPFALGGSSCADNLVLKCRTHNTWSAIRAFGYRKMSMHVPSLK